MLLAAGLGTRMRPLSALRAKPALPVLNRPLLHFTLATLRRAGVREVFINTHHLPATIRRAVGDGAAFGLRVRYSHERRILGSIGGVRRLRRRFGDEPFLLLNGDMVFEFDLRRLIARHARSGALATVSLQPFPKRGRYGAVVTDARGRILSFGGWPRPARGRRWHFTGVHVIEPRILERLRPGYAETARDLYGPLIEEGGKVLGVPLAGPWYDLSSPALYLESQMQLLDKGFAGARARLLVDASARVERGAHVERSVIGRGCAIGAGAVVKDSVLWSGVRVEAGARVERAIATDGVRVRAGRPLLHAIATARRRHTMPR
jgi:NDP-sugar pyrophosphorylase family protein